MTRLESDDKELNDKILDADKNLQRKIMYEACLYAVKKVSLKEDVTQLLLDLLKNNKELPKKYKSEIKKLMNKYDDEYFKLREKEEEDNTKNDTFLIPFRKARAYSALFFCFQTKGIGLAAVEVVYEASVVSDDQNELFSKLHNLF